MTEIRAAPPYAWDRLPTFRFGFNADNIAINPYVYTYGTTDAQEMKAMGGTVVRIPFDVSEAVVGLPSNYAKGLSDTARVDAGFAKLDAAVKLFEDEGLAVEISCFVNKAVVALGPPAIEDALMSANVAIAQRYVALYSPGSLFLGLYNEPRLTADEWNDLAPRLAAVVRAVAPKTTFLIGPPGFNKPANLSSFHTLEDPNIIYVFHHYDPARLTHQGQPGMRPNPDYTYPRPLEGGDPTEMWRASMLAVIDQALDWAAANNVPIVMEEFGLTNQIGDPASRDAWVTDVVGYANEKGLGHLWWSWSGREFGLNPHGKGLDKHLQELLTAPQKNYPEEKVRDFGS